MEATMKAPHTLAIDGMSGDACVQKVTGALKGVAGVTTQSVKVGSAMINADQSGCDAACSAVTGAGYKAKEGARTGEQSGTHRTAGDAANTDKGSANMGYGEKNGIDKGNTKPGMSGQHSGGSANSGGTNSGDAKGGNRNPNNADGGTDSAGKDAERFGGSSSGKLAGSNG